MTVNSFFMPASAFLEYLQYEKKYSAHTVKAYGKDISDFSEFLQKEFEEEHLQNVHYSQVRSWIVSLSENDISNRSINRKISSLKGLYKFFLKTGDIETNPLAKHKALKTSKKVQIPFSRAEVDQVLESLEATDFLSSRDKLLVELFYSTGIRRMELIQIKTTDLDLVSGTLKVLGKRNKERIIPLLKTVANTAETYLGFRKENIDQNIDFLFLTERGDKIYESLVYRIINNYFSKVSGKVKKSPHILRHTFATHLLNQGANLNAVKELLGHSSLASTQVYTHNSIAELSKIHKAAHPRNNKN